MEEEQAVHQIDAYQEDFMYLCKLKVDEFNLLGYEMVTVEDVWQCVSSMMKGSQSLHGIVSTILTLQIGQFMNYQTMNAYKGLLDR